MRRIASMLLHHPTTRNSQTRLVQRQSPPANAPLIDQKYLVRGELGRGAVSKVYRATDITTDEEVAVKLALDRDVLDCSRDHLSDIFINETEALLRIRHPNVVTALGSGAHNGLPYLVMRIVEGTGIDKTRGAARQRLRDMPAFSQVFSDVCDAAHDFHCKGIVHRDLGPHNIIVDAELSTKVIDFGYALVPGVPDYAEKRTGPRDYLGTLQILSPEQAEHKPTTPRTDIYALGVSMYILLTDDLPFEGPPVMDALPRMHRESPVVPIQRRNPSVPDYVAAVIERALSKRPEDRFASMLEMKDALLPYNIPQAQTSYL